MLTLVLPYVKTAREGSCVSERFWKSMEPMSLTGLPFQMSMKSGGWKPSEVTTGWRAVFQMMPM